MKKYNSIRRFENIPTKIIFRFKNLKIQKFLKDYAEVHDHNFVEN